MKKATLGFVLSLLLVVSIFSTALAGTSALPGGGWWSGEQIQNIGTSSAQINITAYNKADDTSFAGDPQTVAAGASFTFTPNNFPGMPEGFEGSAVVSSAAPIKAIVAITNRAVTLPGGVAVGIAGGKATAQYQGIDGAAVDETLYFPLVKANAFNKSTTIYLQNAGTAAATATATFKMANGQTLDYTTPSIPANDMVLFTAFDAGFDDGAVPTQNQRQGSVTITSAQPMAAVVVEYFHAQPGDPNVATLAQSTRAFTGADFSTKLYTPIIKHNRNDAKALPRFTGISVQNVTGAPIDITVDYRGTGGACAGLTYQETKTGIAAGALATFVQQAGNGTPLPTNCAASAIISATGNVVAVVSESYTAAALPGGDQTKQSAVLSSAIPDGPKTTKLSAPLFKDDRAQKRSGFMVMNVGDADATITATFVCGGGSTFTAITKPLTVVPGGTKLFFRPFATQGVDYTAGNPFAASNVVCSATVTSNQPIVGLVNEAGTETLEIDNNNYEAFNIAP